MNHRVEAVRQPQEARRANQVTEKVIGCAIEVHKHLGPGLLESAYEECTCYEMTEEGLAVRRQVPLPVIYKGDKLDCGYRIDAVVEETVILEFKTVEKLLPVHEAQLLSYLRLTGLKVGLLINFHVPVLKDGLKRLMN
jgi:GxxExxY protein